MAKQRAIALGTFDGLHRGHWEVLNGTKQDDFTPSALLFFEHPASVLANAAPPALCTEEKRNALLQAAGMEPLYVDFREIMALSPRAFFQEILVKRFSAGLLCCGENYTFGKGKSGDPAVLKALCDEYGVRLFVANTVEVDGAPVSSTRIRQALETGAVEAANRMLGRPFSYAFPVVEGDKRGRKLHFPTVNQFFPDGFVQPKFGVYASFAEIDGKRYPAVTNFGARPTIGTKTVRSETYLVGFSGDLYGQSPEIQWLSYLRPEQKFLTLSDLQAAIAKDAVRVEEIFKNTIANGA
ncbi:MAG: riboflavin biosynthesis protein RibF [Clostridia bacterium]|nr:riboflavin biosynthesis protein RibF [Clostridia bacterium]